MLKYQYSYKNHFKFGYRPDNWFQKRQSENQIFTACYGPIEREIHNWRKANLLAAEKISETQRHRPLVICLSGGTDSEACVRSFVEARVDFSVAIMAFENGINDVDVGFAFQLCKELKIPHKVYTLDIIGFWDSRELLALTDRIYCVSPIIACQLWLASQVNGVPIIAQGEPHFKKAINENYVSGVSPYEPSPWYLVESERLCSMYMHFILNDIPAIPAFFQFLPEQFYSFLQNNPVFEKLIANQVVGKLGTRTSKNEIVRSFYPEIKPRLKLTGIEKIQDIHDRKRLELARRYPWNDQNCRIDLQDLHKQLEVRK